MSTPYTPDPEDVEAVARGLVWEDGLTWRYAGLSIYRNRAKRAITTLVTERGFAPREDVERLKAQVEHWKNDASEWEKLSNNMYTARVGQLEAALLTLADAADVVGVKYFDTDDMSPEVSAMQKATLEARAALGITGD